MNNYHKTHTLLVIGNGFDKGSGLHSSFDEFLSKKSHVLENISNSVKNLHDNIVNIDENTVNVGRVDNNLKSYQIHELNNIVRTYSAHAYSNFNFWCLYLYVLKELGNVSNHILWSDVEQQIYYLCNKIYVYSKSNEFYDIYGNNLSIIKLFKGWLDNSPLNESPYRNAVLEFMFKHMTKEHKGKADNLLCMAIVISFEYCGLIRYINKVKKSRDITNFTQLFYNFLFYQLQKFDQEFAGYLRDDIENVGTYYMDREKGLNQLTFPDETYNLLTFNYTGDPRKDKDNKRCNKYLPIHSDIDHHPIIGISDNACRDNHGNDKGFFEFSKVSQILSLNNREPTIADMVSGIDCIKFYGHSLALADYPYFKYIFDECHLKDNDHIKLMFYYTDYDGLNHDFTNRMNQVKSVYKLLDKYDSDLKMKLILERRVKIIRIKGWK